MIRGRGPGDAKGDVAGLVHAAGQLAVHALRRHRQGLRGALDGTSPDPSLFGEAAVDGPTLTRPQRSDQRPYGLTAANRPQPNRITRHGRCRWVTEVRDGVVGQPLPGRLGCWEVAAVASSWASWSRWWGVEANGLLVSTLRSAFT